MSIDQAGAVLEQEDLLGMKPELGLMNGALAIPRRDHDRFADVLDFAPVGIAEVGGDGRLLRVNAHLAGLLGCAPADLVGRSIFDPMLAEETEEDQAQFQRQVRGEIDQYAIEKRLRRPYGGRLWTSIVSSSIRDDEGHFLYAIRVQHDITGRKIAEQELERRAEQQAALHEFAEGLQQADGIEDIYTRAVTAITRALRCDRAAILLADRFGVMRFVASRGLSQIYRNAVEGHSPWERDARDPEPICIPDIDLAELSEDLKSTVRAEGIRALAFIPVLASGCLIGKFMTYHDHPHLYTRAEIDLARTIARQLGLAIEHTRAAQASRQLVAIVESSHDAIVSKDLNGIIATWNRGAERLFGYTAEEVVGKSVTIIIPPDRLDEEPQILARIRRGELVDHFETVRVRKDGRRIDVSLTISPVRDEEGRIVGASKIARDITEQKIMEAKLRDSERWLKDLLSAIPAAIYTTDARGKITYYNQAAVELAGRTPELGSDEWCVTWKLYKPDGTRLPHDECPMAVALKEGRAIRNAEAVAERPDGSRVPFIPYPTPLRDACGNIVGAINMLVDISERKQAETQQRILFNELNHRVKNNMQMLQALLHIAGRKASSREAQAVLNEASGRVAAMAAAQQILYGTKDATRYGASAFIEAVCNNAKSALAGDIDIANEAEDLELSNDTAMPLALILNELLTNAAKHGSNGNGRPVIRVGLVRESDAFCLYVEDEGPGFDLDAVRARSSGLQLITGLAGQLRGKFTVTKGNRTRCSVQFS
ncbi:MAG TPA: PAS domain S-box protein [Xanthobacteraceae bacterium]|nr:PAS domain S-box protein [Xanthobacteraceae bacterium]